MGQGRQLCGGGVMGVYRARGETDASLKKRVLVHFLAKREQQTSYEGELT